jgi:hypothetical protein
MRYREVREVVNRGGGGGESGVWKATFEETSQKAHLATDRYQSQLCSSREVGDEARCELGEDVAPVFSRR